MADAQALAAEPGFNCDMAALVRRMGACVWKFDHLVPGQPPFVAFHRSLHRSPVIDLSRGHDAYLTAVRQRSSNVISDTARRRRKVERERGPVVIEWDSRSTEDLATVMGWKSAQYRRTGRPDLFAQSWAVNIVRELAAEQSEDCSGLLFTLRVGDELVAGQLDLARGSTLSSWFPAFDREYRLYSPGLVLLLGLAAEAAEHGIERMDLGRGENDYKLRVANESYAVAAGRVPAHGVTYRAALRVRHLGWVPRKVRTLRGKRAVLLRSP
jgi:CelD/BcsL family acetyltransferase involved in cellulose biosynthesis